MKITLVNIRDPRALFRLLNTCTGPVSCYGIDLRHNQKVEELICGMAAPGKDIPQLELRVCGAEDFYRLVRYMQEGCGTAA